MVKKLFLVRHGESEANAANVQLGGEGHLTAKGKMEAKKLAGRFRKIPVDLILASDYERSLETAEIICRKIRKKLLVTELLREQRSSKEYLGRRYEQPRDPVIARIAALRKKYMNKKNWHYSDEENFFDALKRAKKFLRFVERRKKKNIVAVGHARFNRVIIGAMVFGKAFTPEIFYKLYDNFKTVNTGITFCELQEGKWRIITWNDHAHLG
ncbi:MAG: Phosphoglycerate mutase/fructose-2,6-bisphosphatase [Parcubacteria group bacterium Gr01-1014_30]|nr:MAG: Phosphoglycerate mutase/fructose-2,6-bisphosphatase [Parcubacteria group bacterium Gr01-1014_30]